MCNICKNLVSIYWTLTRTPFTLARFINKCSLSGQISFAIVSELMAGRLSGFSYVGILTSSNFAPTSVVVISFPSTHLLFDPTFIIPAENWKNCLVVVTPVSYSISTRAGLSRPSLFSFYLYGCYLF